MLYLRHQPIIQFIASILVIFSTPSAQAQSTGRTHTFNGVYRGAHLDHIAFPIGGIGAGMFCLEGTGAISHMSVRNSPDVFNEPVMFAAISLKGAPSSARVLEGPVPDWKKFGMANAGRGAPGTDWGLPRFKEASFLSRFPFAELALNDNEIPLAVTITGWSPFIPTDADNSSLPVGALEYHFKNTGAKSQDYVFSYSARNFMATNPSRPGMGDHIKSIRNGFILSQDADKSAPENKGDFAIFADAPQDSVTVDHRWFQGGWYDPLTIAWNHIQQGLTPSLPPVEEGASGASLFVTFHLQPGQEKTIRVLIAWYVPNTNIRLGQDAVTETDQSVPDRSETLPSPFHKPWYTKKFKSIEAIADYWLTNFSDLRKNSLLFKDAFYKSTLPPEVVEAVAANLSILKSPTTLRQYDGRFWGWEGCYDAIGSCAGSCTHVWNYAQALPHLFPALERSLRETEFGEDQDKLGHQSFRASLPIRPLAHTFYAAADGQLGGIIKLYREWRIAGDSTWLLKLYDEAVLSLDYCIHTWDPEHIGAIEEPHHNTYDIEFWGPEPLCTGIYLEALEAMIKMGAYLKKDTHVYSDLLQKGQTFMTKQLFNGQFFCQKVKWTGLHAKDPVESSKNSFGGDYSEDALEILKKEGPKYQYGTGCLSDGMLGIWLARVSGLPTVLDSSLVNKHLLAVFNYNFKKDLSDHSNPQRPTYALGKEGGLLLCSWPNGGKPTLPFVYSNEVWTGIEYQVAAHLIFAGKLKEGLQIVKICRSRYDGRVRNPFDEYECGHWYARAMSSYSLLESLTGVRYDAVEKTLYVHSRVGDFTSFLSTDTGFGDVSCKNGKASVLVVYGKIQIERIVYSE